MIGCRNSAPRVLLFLTLLCAGAWAQQAAKANPAEESKRQLESWRQSMAQRWMNDFADLERYRDADAALAAPTPDEKRVVFMGDSITDAWQLPEYFPGEPYLNRGIGGQTTPQMLIRFRPDVLDLRPKVVVILAGTNDIAGNTGPMRLADIENNLASMAELAHAHGIRVVLASVTPVNDYTARAEPLFLQRPPAKILQLNDWLKGYCQQNGYVYLDYFAAMVDAQGMLKRDLAEDGLHPNPAGYRIMATLAEKAIEQALAGN